MYAFQLFIHQIIKQNEVWDIHCITNAMNFKPI